jgi:hypothetical protein
MASRVQKLVATTRSEKILDAYGNAFRQAGILRDRVLSRPTTPTLLRQLRRVCYIPIPYHTIYHYHLTNAINVIHQSHHRRSRANRSQ